MFGTSWNFETKMAEPISKWLTKRQNTDIAWTSEFCRPLIHPLTICSTHVYKSKPFVYHLPVSTSIPTVPKPCRVLIAGPKTLHFRCLFGNWNIGPFEISVRLKWTTRILCYMIRYCTESEFHLRPDTSR